MNRLHNKVAIITGAAQGMGAAHARLFISQGAKVLITDINTAKGEALADELGDDALFIKHDVTSEVDWQEVVNCATAHFGTIDVLVNNAGITMAKPLLETSVDDYMQIVKINQLSVFLGTKAVVPSMLSAKTGQLLIYLLLMA